MPYGVTMFADSDTEAVIWNIWNKLKESGITTFMLDNKVRPHITMAVYDELDTEKFLEKFLVFVRDSSPVPLILSSVGTFLEPLGTVFVQPALTPQLTEMHRDFLERFSDHNAHLQKYSRPGKWIPHFTLSSRLEEREVLKTVEMALGAEFPPESLIQEIGFGEFRFHEENRSYRVNWLYNFSLSDKP
mgnify:CR=1 FL=1